MDYSGNWECYCWSLTAFTCVRSTIILNLKSCCIFPENGHKIRLKNRWFFESLRGERRGTHHLLCNGTPQGLSGAFSKSQPPSFMPSSPGQERRVAICCLGRFTKQPQGALQFKGRCGAAPGTHQSTRPGLGSPWRPLLLLAWWKYAVSFYQQYISPNQEPFQQTTGLGSSSWCIWYWLGTWLKWNLMCTQQGNWLNSKRHRN